MFAYCRLFAVLLCYCLILIAVYVGLCFVLACCVVCLMLLGFRFVVYFGACVYLVLYGLVFGATVGLGLDSCSCVFVHGSAVLCWWLWA